MYKRQAWDSWSQKGEGLIRLADERGMVFDDVSVLRLLRRVGAVEELAEGGFNGGEFGGDLGAVQMEGEGNVGGHLLAALKRHLGDAGVGLHGTRDLDGDGLDVARAFHPFRDLVRLAGLGFEIRLFIFEGVALGFSERLALLGIHRRLCLLYTSRCV